MSNLNIVVLKIENDHTACKIKEKSTAAIGTEQGQRNMMVKSVLLLK